MTNEVSIKNLSKIKDGILFVLILTLFLIPLLKHFSFTYSFALKNDYNILKILGILGIYFLLFYIYLQYDKNKNLKQFFKELSPIFILLIYMIWTFIASVFSPDTSLAFFGTSYRKDGFITYLLYAGCFGLSFGISSKKIKVILLYLFSIIAIISITLIELSKLGVFYKFISFQDMYTGSFSNSNHFGYYLLIATVISSFLFISEKNKILKTIAFFMYSFLLYYLILNNTFGCYLALISTFILFLITTILKKEQKKSIIVCICVFIVLSIFTNFNAKNITGNNIQTLLKDLLNITTQSSNNKEWKKAGSGRMQLWYHGLQFITKSPLIGYGPENLEKLYLDVGIDQDRAHNLLIQLATTSGIPGLILYLLAIGIILFRSIKKYSINNQVHAVCLFSVIAYLISAMFGNSMYYTSPYFFIILGFLFNELLTIKDIKK